MANFRKGKKAKVNRFATNSYDKSCEKRQARRKNVSLLFARIESHDMQKFALTIRDGHGAVFFRAVDYLSFEAVSFAAEEQLARLKAMEPAARDRLLISGQYPPVNQ